MGISEQIVADQEAFKQEMIALIRVSAQNGGQPSSMGTQNGNCIACGRGPSNFQPLPVKLPSRRKSMEMSKRMSSPSNDKLDKLIDSKLSPKSAQRRKSTMSHMADNAGKKQSKVVVENDPVRVKIPDINDA